MQPGADGRNRPRHIDLRRHGARRVDRTRAGRKKPLDDDVCDALLRVDATGGAASGDRQRARRRSRSERQGRVPARSARRAGESRATVWLWRSSPACRARWSDERVRYLRSSRSARSARARSWISLRRYRSSHRESPNAGDQLRATLRALDLDSMSPRDAHMLLEELQRQPQARLMQRPSRRLGNMQKIRQRRRIR